MPSKKQKAKAAKAGTTSRMPLVNETSASQSRVLNRAAIQPGHVSPGDSPFLRKLPREIRDKIYEELLIVRLTPKMATEKKQEMEHGEAAYGLYGREATEDSWAQDVGLLPGGSGNYGSRFIGKNKGILLANKQIYEEACSVLFGQNLFVALPESERIWAFWRCDSMGCTPIERPCYVRPENASKVKHLMILVSNPRHPSDREIYKDDGRLYKNLQTIGITLKQAKVKLKTLKIRYWSCYGGEVEALRSELERPVYPGLPERKVMMANSIRGNFSTFTRKEVEQEIFLHARNVLEAILGLKKVAEDVCVRGDIPQALVDEMEEALAVDVVASRKRKKATEDKSRVWLPPTASSSLADMAGDPNMRNLYESLIKTTVKSPTVVDSLMTSRPLGRPFGPDGATTPLAMAASILAGNANTASEQQENADGNQDVPQASVNPATSGAIGFIAGKPVFGPPRPPVGGA